MNDRKLSELIVVASERAKKELRNNIYLLKTDTVKKLRLLDGIFNDSDYKAVFDASTNSVEITALGFVFDSMTNDLKKAFSAVVLFVMDSTADGRVCIEMKILNAADVAKRG